MIDGSEKRDRQLAFELQNSHVCEKRNNFLKKKNQSVWNFEVHVSSADADDITLSLRKKMCNLKQL